MASPFKMYLDRTMNKLRRETIKIVKMDPAPATPPITIYSFNSNLPPVNQEIDLVSGSDIDIGGYTTAKFTPVPISSESSSSSSTLHGLPTPPPSPTSTGSSTPNSVLSHIAFHGTMSLKVPPQYADKVKAGYAGMRNRRRTTLFGEDTWDLGSYTHIKVVVAYRGWEGWRNRWYCNVQTDGPILTDLYQHRLDLAPSPSSSTSTAPLDPTSGPAPIFRTLHLPISSFVLTNSGQTSEHQIPMMSSKIRTVGFSLLGGSRNEDMVPTRSTLTPAKIQEMRRLASSGYAGKDRQGSDMRGLDPELEQMLREDGVDVSQLTDESNVAAASWKEPIKQTAYHRITPASESNKGEESAEQKAASAVAITPWSEGYYELSIQSVEGVKMDDKLGAEDRDM